MRLIGARALLESVHMFNSIYGLMRTDIFAERVFSGDIRCRTSVACRDDNARESLWRFRDRFLGFVDMWVGRSPRTTIRARFVSFLRRARGTVPKNRATNTYVVEADWCRRQIHRYRPRTASYAQRWRP